MTPHKEWFYQYEKFGGDVLLGDDLTIKIFGWGRVQLILKNGRKRILLGMLHILGLA